MTVRGVKQLPRMVNPYVPATLVAFALRSAIDATTYPSLRQFVTGMSDRDVKTTGGLNSKIDRADRRFVQVVQDAVNKHLADDVQPFRLTALYDAVAPPHAADELDSFHTEGELPAHYFAELSNAGVARSRPEAIVRGMAARAFLLDEPADLNMFAYDGDPPLDGLARRTYSDILDMVIDDLLITACAPPTSGGLEATRLLGDGGTLTIARVRPHVEKGSPVSWRLLRVVTECIRRARQWEGEDSGKSRKRRSEFRRPERVYDEANRLLRTLHEQNPPCAYRARSLWEEAVSRLPKRGREYEWIGEALYRRAVHGRTGRAEGVPGRPDESLLPVRERMTAAWALLWRTARAAGWRPATLTSPIEYLDDDGRVRLLELATALRDSRIVDPSEERSDWDNPDRGIAYAGEFIERILQGMPYWVVHGENEAAQRSSSAIGSWQPAPNTDPSPEEQLVRECLDEEAASSTLSAHLRPGFESLAQQALLTIDGVARRECLTTLLYAQLADSAARVFRAVVQRARAHPGRSGIRWLVEHSTFALGWMSRVEDVGFLSDLAVDGKLQPSIRMTAMMAMSDVIDGKRNDLAAAQARGAFEATVHEIGGAFASDRSNQDPREFKLLLRTALYGLAMLRMPDDAGKESTLSKICAAAPFEPEDTTRAVAQWGLDRIRMRALADAVAALEDPEMKALPEHVTDLIRDTAHQRGRGRSFGDQSRMVDPLASLERVQGRR